MQELFRQIAEVFKNLFNSQELMAVLSQPEITIAAFIALNIIVFCETGMLIGFFLPGDSLLVTAGIVAYNSSWPLVWLISSLTTAAIIGDSVGYWIGYRSGKRLFNKPKSRFFRPEYLISAQNFYDRHGGKTIVLARFMPFIRTFAPVVAGIGKMSYSRFLLYNIFGGLGWIISMIMIGYLLTPVLQPALQPIFGENFKIQKHIEKVILVVIFISISPMLWAGLRHYWQRRSSPVPTPASASTSPPIENLSPISSIES